MEIRAEEISRIIRSQIEGFDAQVDVAEVGTDYQRWRRYCTSLRS